MFSTDLCVLIEHHRVYGHRMFLHLAERAPAPDALGAFYHQMEIFCAATRDPGELLDGVVRHGLGELVGPLREIFEDERSHRESHLTMAAHIMARLGSEEARATEGDVSGIADLLTRCATQRLQQIEGFDPRTSMPPQTAAAVRVFSHRHHTDVKSVYFSLGAMLVVEVLANRQIIPGEKRALIDSGRYHCTLDEPQMHYIKEHWGELGAEHEHEQRIRSVIDQIKQSPLRDHVQRGVSEACQTTAAFYDVLDSTLLHGPSQVRATDRP